jgi:MbtH protein
MSAFQRLIAALWVGSGFFLMLAASAAFRTAPNPTAAADIVGAMLARWHYIALAAPLALFAMGLRNARRAMLITLFVAIVLASVQALVDLQIRSIRASSIVPISSLEREDPIRKRFGALHGVSMLLLVCQTVAAAAVVMSPSKKKEERATMSNWELDDGTTYRVVVNAEEQYSIWPVNRQNPLGWSDAGFQGTKPQCLAYIQEIWTELRPRRSRDTMPDRVAGMSAAAPEYVLAASADGVTTIFPADQPLPDGWTEKQRGSRESLLSAL